MKAKRGDTTITIDRSGSLELKLLRSKARGSVAKQRVFPNPDTNTSFPPKNLERTSFCSSERSLGYYSTTFLIHRLPFVSVNIVCLKCMHTNVLMFWNVRDYSFCDLIGHNQILGVSRTRVYGCHQTFPFLCVKVWLAISRLSIGTYVVLDRHSYDKVKLQ